MIKAVLFDVGGVLNAGGGDGSPAELFGTDADYDLYADLHQQFMRGVIDEVAFFAELNRVLPEGSAEVTADTFQHGAMKTFQQVPELYELAKTLRAHGIRTGILSNALPLAKAYLRANGFYDGFGPVLLSCDEKLAKPEEAIYERALKRLQLEPDEILFIDDQEKYLMPARDLGMRTILAESPSQVIKDTRELLKTENNLELEL